MAHAMFFTLILHEQMDTSNKKNLLVMMMIIVTDVRLVLIVLTHILKHVIVSVDLPRHF